MASVDDYSCDLDDFALEKAKRELNEEPAERLGAVQALREWVQQQKHLSLPTDTSYLLRYLRTAKFSQLRARTIIEGNLELRTKFPYWYQNLDTHDPDQMFPLKRGMMVVLPGRDREGRKVLLARQGILTKKELDMISKDKEKRRKMFKGFFIMFSHLMCDEKTQVHGFIDFYDFSHYTMQHFTSFPMGEMQDMMSFQGKIPGRLKGFYYYNTPAFFETVMAVFKPLMKKKMKDRIKILGSNLENVYEHVPKEMLPVEYLPDDYTGPNAGTLDQLTENLCKELEQNDVRERILSETDPKWRIDLKQKDTEAPAASFRKLNVD